MTGYTTQFLSDAEVASICEPLKSPSAQCRYLSKLGLLVNRKPNGKALVARSEFERVLGADRLKQSDVSVTGDIEALRKRWKGRG